MRVGIDMTFLKPMKTGGIESYVINLLNGFFNEKDKNEYYLFMAKDNIDYFKEKFNDSRIKWILCKTEANKVISHLAWQVFRQNSLYNKYKIDVAFYPSYMMPFFKPKKYKTIAVVQDIQALHFPEYFPLSQRIWFNIAWRKMMFTADTILTTTEYTKKDIEEHFKHTDNIKSIFIPIVINEKELVDFKKLENKYSIENNNYYYTVLSMLRHKNLITLINMIKEIKDKDIKGIPNILVVSGVNGPSKEELEEKIKEYGLEENVILTGFVSNSERNTLIKNSNVFLFPSVFEGFGMPPIEAMHFGAKVVTTKCASLPEVTMNKCSYVNDPYSVDCWIKEITKLQNKKSTKFDFKEFDQKIIARKYLEEFKKLNSKRVK